MILVKKRSNMLFIIAIILLGANHINANCKKLLGELGDAESKFAYCATTNSVPVKFCSTCEEHYKNLTMTYAALRNETDCVKQYFDNDRLNLVSSTEASLGGLWAKGHCDNCNKNITSEFDARSTEFYDCLKTNEDPCIACMNNYLSLNNFYLSLDEHYSGKVCFDYQDAMNRTRNTWSKDKKCCRREFKMTLFAVAVCIVTCLQILFYGGTYIVTKRQERNHGILNDNDPLFNASSPSSSNTVVNLNIQSGEVPSCSVQGSNVNTKQSQNKCFTKLEESDESDEENLAQNSTKNK